MLAFYSWSEIRSLVFLFRANRSFFCKKEFIALLLFLKEQIALIALLGKSKENNSLFCFGNKKGKSRAKRTNMKYSLQEGSKLTLKKSELLFYKERIALVALYCFFEDQQEQRKRWERFTLVSLFKRAKRAEERRAKEWIPNPDLKWQCNEIFGIFPPWIKPT